MVSDLYVFDLDTFTWEKISPFPEDDVPEPRYFHSAETCKSPACSRLPLLITRSQGTINSLFLVEWEALQVLPAQRIFVS